MEKHCSNCFNGTALGLCMKDGVQAEYPNKGVCTDWETNDIYQINGYENRNDYLQAMADEYDCPLETVSELADILGAEEDFDGLISSLEDYEVIQ